MLGIFPCLECNYFSQESLHGRELTCVKYLRSTTVSRICVTASEDTFINVVTFTGSEFKVIHRLHGHISSVRTLAVSACNVHQGTESRICPVLRQGVRSHWRKVLLYKFPDCGSCLFYFGYNALCFQIPAFIDVTWICLFHMWKMCMCFTIGRRQFSCALFWRRQGTNESLENPCNWKVNSKRRDIITFLCRMFRKCLVSIIAMTPVVTT